MTDQFVINALRESLIETREVALHLMATMDEVSLGHDLPTKFHGFGARANVAIAIAEDRVRDADKAPNFQAWIAAETIGLLNVGYQIGLRRNEQDARWGGPEHDDKHNECDWIAFIRQQLDKYEDATFLNTSPNTNGTVFEDRMIDVAALAIAAIESHRRRADAPDR